MFFKMFARKKRSKIISKASDCNISRFMACRFDKNYKALIIEGEPTESELLAAWEKLYTEYLDKCSKETPYELQLIAKIESIELRITIVQILIELQKTSIYALGFPYFKAFEKLKTYGYSLTWNEETQDRQGFLKQLENAITNENRYTIQKNKAEHELKTYRGKQKANQDTKDPEARLFEEREKFILNMVILQKNGYVISKENTMIEELTIMMKAFNRYVEELKAANKALKNK